MSTTNMSKSEAIATMKAINRSRIAREYGIGGRVWGCDFTTWYVQHPQIAQTFVECAEIVTGRKGRFMPKFGR